MKLAQELGVLDNGVLKHAPLSGFTWNKNGQVLITYSLGAAYDMTDFHYYIGPLALPFYLLYVVFHEFEADFKHEVNLKHHL